MRPEADERTEVPLPPAGGSSASGNGHQGDISMQERVARERKRLEESILLGEQQLADHPESLPTLDDLSAFIKKADADLSKPAKATARRSGTNPPPRKATRRRERNQIEDISDEELLADAGIEPFYSTIEASHFFDKSTQWMYWGLGRNDGIPKFIYPDGTPIVPQRIGDGPNARRRFTLPIIKDILLSSYRRGNVEPDDLKRILRRIRINELGGEWRDREGWHRIKGKWVPPHKCEKVNGKWIKKKETPSGDNGIRES